MLPRIKREKIKKNIAIYDGFLNELIINPPINPRLINFVPNESYHLGGYWIESLKQGSFQSIIYEKIKQKISQYKITKKEVNAFIKDFNLEYQSIKKITIFWEN